MEWVFTIDQIKTTADLILDWIKSKGAVVIALNGSMGAGKTTFSAALINAMGSKDAVSSPTYSIINEYADQLGQAIYHMDWYRLNSEEDAVAAGVEDPLNSGCWCMVEWPEKAIGLLPENTIYLSFEVLPNGNRKIAG